MYQFHEKNIPICTCYDMTQRKQSEQEATTYSLYSLLFMYFMGLCVVILFKNKRFMLDEMPPAKYFKVCHIFLYFMLHITLLPSVIVDPWSIST